MSIMQAFRLGPLGGGGGGGGGDWRPAPTWNGPGLQIPPPTLPRPGLGLAILQIGSIPRALRGIGQKMSIVPSWVVCVRVCVCVGGGGGGGGGRGAGATGGGPEWPGKLPQSLIRWSQLGTLLEPIFGNRIERRSK